jgi:hypothetical protein
VKGTRTTRHIEGSQSISTDICRILKIDGVITDTVISRGEAPEGLPSVPISAKVKQEARKGYGCYSTANFLKILNELEAK